MTKQGKTVMLIFGTRPEAIKMCPLVNELKRRTAVRTVVLVTGQHRTMLDQVLRFFQVIPDYDLAVMQQEQTLPEVTSRMIGGIDSVLAREKVDMVLVHGDTATAFAAALACFYRRIPIGHVEAGLRTYRMNAPFPEEFHRQAIDMMASYYFAPTELAEEHLIREGKPGERIYVTGSTAIDALLTTVRKDYVHPELEWAEGSRLLIVTAHRRETIGEPMRQMLRAVRRIVADCADVKVLCPLHRNPHVRRIAEEVLGGCERVHVTEPMEVADFHNLLARCDLVLTDSGGIQEEASFLGKPVLVMREVTERQEGEETGALRVVGTDEESIYRSTREVLADRAKYRAMADAECPYGDGFACRIIADAVEELLTAATR